MLTVRCYTRDDGRRKAEIFRRPDGFYSFEESVLELEIEPDEIFSPSGEKYWESAYLSGLHENLESAEAEAKNALPWLRSYLQSM